jgi:F-box protein 9
MHFPFPYTLTMSRIMEDTNPELESFREQWRAEVSARAREVPKSNAGPLKTFRRPPPITSLSSSRVLKTVKEDDDYVDTQMALSLDGSSSVETEHGESSKRASKEPETALEHYEKAVERETQGSLGDSLNLYRKAYRVGFRYNSISQSLT